MELEHRKHVIPFTGQVVGKFLVIEYDGRYGIVCSDMGAETIAKAVVQEYHESKQGITVRIANELILHHIRLLVATGALTCEHVRVSFDCGNTLIPVKPNGSLLEWKGCPDVFLEVIQKLGKIRRAKTLP